MEYHRPVMLEECMQGLALKPGGHYADLTFGGGGHSRELLARLEGGKLYAFDQDEDARLQAEKLQDDRLEFIAANFRYVKRYLKLHGAPLLDGILADLGVSSHQFDAAERGFSTRFDAALDMRMDQQAPLTAQEIVNTYSEEALWRLLGEYGEVRNAKTLASALVSARVNAPIESTQDLNRVLDRFAPKGKENKYRAQVFQALRIVVNDEMPALQEMLQGAADVLKPGGRLVIMSYHSLEDRLVKNFMNKGRFSGEVEKDFYGNPIKPLHALTRKPVEASAEEVTMNNRARSARLRIAEKI